jgi:hypothetical protein
MPSFKKQVAKHFPHILAGDKEENILMKTINFTNRERIMISDDKEQFLTCLAQKLPQPLYENQKVVPDKESTMKSQKESVLQPKYNI